ncbi:MAG: hypothetical protein D6722_06970 [Bacteroidetes bacterium]|nr:MAG: hypothetical protein D6722_06970 [Bacteroidota bacterium]
MKPLSFAFLPILLLSLSLTACKYEDGPLISLSSPAKRVANVWEVDRATNADGDDVSDDFDTWEFTFEEDGTAEVTFDILSFPTTLTGDWNLLDSDQNLQLLTSDPTGLVTFNEEFVITRLTTKELWLRDVSDSLRTFQLEVK